MRFSTRWTPDIPALHRQVEYWLDPRASTNDHDSTKIWRSYGDLEEIGRSFAKQKDDGQGKSLARACGSVSAAASIEASKRVWLDHLPCASLVEGRTLTPRLAFAPPRKGLQAAMRHSDRWDQESPPSRPVAVRRPGNLRALDLPRCRPTAPAPARWPVPASSQPASG